MGCQMRRLADHASNVYSQFGEDGMLDYIFTVLGVWDGFCVEFGASDGVSCSNTRRLRERGWSAMLIEAEPSLWEQLDKEASDRVRCIHDVVTPENLNHYLAGNPVDFMSIDVDGDDFAIFEMLEVDPTVVCIEYNASIPPHVALRQKHLGGELGASARSLCELAAAKGYRLLEVTRGNLIFLHLDKADGFVEYESDLNTLFDSSQLTYMATDFKGRPIGVGSVPPWGLSGVPHVSETTGDPTIPIVLYLEALREAFETIYGPGLVLQKEFAVEIPDDRRRRLMRCFFRDNPELILIDIGHHQPTADFEWINDVCRTLGRKTSIVPSGVIAVLPRSF